MLLPCGRRCRGAGDGRAEGRTRRCRLFQVWKGKKFSGGVILDFAQPTFLPPPPPGLDKNPHMTDFMARARGSFPPPGWVRALPALHRLLPAPGPGQRQHHRPQKPLQLCPREPEHRELLPTGKRQHRSSQRIPARRCSSAPRARAQGKVLHRNCRDCAVARSRDRQQSWKETQLSALLLPSKGPEQPQSEIWQVAKSLLSHTGIFATGLAQKHRTPLQELQWGQTVKQEVESVTARSRAAPVMQNELFLLQKEVWGFQQVMMALTPCSEAIKEANRTGYYSWWICYSRDGPRMYVRRGFKIFLLLLLINT